MTMENSKNNAVAMLVLVTVAFGIALLAVSFERGELRNKLADFKKEAVSRGFAEYEVLEENKTEFVWKEK